MQTLTERIQRNLTSLARKGVLGMALILAGSTGGLVSVAQAAPPDFGIDSQDDFARLIDSIRATEYVREDYVVRMRHPRIVAAVASLTAYAQMNPNADETQLATFVAEYDATIQSTFSGDPDLLRPDNFMRALRFTRLEHGTLAGTSTQTGANAAGLLGVGVPDPDNFAATQTRMVRYSQGLATNWQHNPRFAHLLVQGFFGVLPSGAERDGLTSVLTGYLEDQGYSPLLGGVSADPNYDGVNQAIGMLPTSYNEFVSVINQPLATNPLVLNSDVAGESLRTLIDLRLDELSQNLDNEPGMVEGQALAADMSIVQQIVDEQQESLIETSDERTLLYGTVILLGQSPLQDLGDYATQYEQYNASLLLASDNMAEINVGLGLASHLLTFGIGVATSNPTAAVSGFFGLVSDGIAIADLAQGGSSTPSVDEQIYGQVLALRQQVESLRIEMNHRFNRIELQLGFMYDQMAQGFNALGNQIGDLQNSVDSILLQMNIVRSELARLEAALYGMAQDILLTDLTDAANTVLDYRDENNIDLAYADQNPSFITGSVDFFTFATNTARTQAFAGSRDAPTLNMNNAAALLASAPIARYLNDLAVLPPSFGEPPLAFATVPAPEPWAQAASAYAQLARENPWYFAFRYEQQLENYNSDPQNESLPELDDIIESGEQLVGIGTNALSESLFDSLVGLYKTRTQALQQAIDDLINAQLTADQLRTSDGSSTLDLWSQDGAMPDIESLFAEYAPGHTNAFREVRWWLEPGSINRIMETEVGLPLLGGHLVGADDLTLAEQIATFEYLYQLDGNGEHSHRIFWDAIVPAPLLRGPFATSPDFSIRYEIDTDLSSNSESWVEAYTRTVKSSMDLQITTVGEPFWYPIWLYYTDNDNSRYCSSDLIIAGGSADHGWDAFMTGMPFGMVEGMELFSSVTNDGESGDFSFLSNGGSCGEWNLTTTEEYDIFRVRPYADTVSMIDQSDPLSGNIFEYLTRYREQNVRPQVLAAFADQSSAVWQATIELDEIVTLIGAYIELAAPDSVRKSEIIRSATRAAPGASEIGLRSGDVVALVNRFTSDAGEHDPRTPGEVGDDINAIESILNARVDFLHEEINRALAQPQSVPAYVQWMLDELGILRDRAFELAEDDTYISDGMLVVDDASGVMSNDTLQEYRVIEVDLGYGLSASNGSVSMNPDGSFEYAPDAGFSGVDSFEYRLVGTILEGMPDPADGVFVSEPAMVVVRVQSGACGVADLTGDGVLNFFDVSAFLVGFGAQDPIADLNGDGQYNFFDVSVFLVAYSDGCP